MTRSWLLAESESVIKSFVLQSYEIGNAFFMGLIRPIGLISPILLILFIRFQILSWGRARRNSNPVPALRGDIHLDGRYLAGRLLDHRGLRGLLRADEYRGHLRAGTR